jgi:hypothetical protein
MQLKISAGLLTTRNRIESLRTELQLFSDIGNFLGWFFDPHQPIPIRKISVIRESFIFHTFREKK